MGIFSSGGVGIDLGSSYTTVFLEGRGVALKEPTRVLATRSSQQEVLAVGLEAQNMLGRTAEDVQLTAPVAGGAVADVEMASLILLALTEKAAERRKPMDKGRLVVTLSQGATKVERAALISALSGTGAKRASALRAPMAVALGAGIGVEAPKGVMVVDIGGGTTEIAVLSMNGVVAACCLRFGGLFMDEAVARYYRRERGLIIGLRTAEEIKCDLGTVLPLQEQGESVRLRGRDAATGKPAVIQTHSGDVLKALEEPVTLLIDGMRRALSNTPPELAADVLESGLYLAGGGALLHGLEERIQRETGVPVNLVDHPQDVAALGAGRVAMDERLLEQLLVAGTCEE